MSIRKIRRNMAEMNGQPRSTFRTNGKHSVLSDKDPWHKHPSVVRKLRKMGIIVHPRLAA